MLFYKWNTQISYISRSEPLIYQQCMHKVGYASTFQTVLSSFMLTFSTNICTMFGRYAIFVSPEFPWLFDLSLITSFQNRSFLDLRFTNWSTANNVAGQDSLARRLWSDWVNLPPPPPPTSPTPYVQGTTSVITWLRKSKRFVAIKHCHNERLLVLTVYDLYVQDTWTRFNQKLQNICQIYNICGLRLNRKHL